MPNSKNGHLVECVPQGDVIYSGPTADMRLQNFEACWEEPVDVILPCSIYIAEDRKKIKVS